MVARSDEHVSGAEPQPPSRAAYYAELPRLASALGELAFSWRGLSDAPRGDMRPVLLLPGLANGDASMAVMHRFLRGRGYRTWRWRLGVNLGVRSVGRDVERLIARIAHVHAAAGGEKVTLIGVSLGGILARVVAHRRPDLVREVVTLSSPYAGPPSATNVWRHFEWLTGQKVGDAAARAMLAEAAMPLPMPATSIWSRSDGFVNGAICHEGDRGDARAIEVASNHIGVHLRPQVLRAIAETLARDRSQSGSLAR
ncbi:MAG: alpha/beta fold hydrolase [Sphingomonas sp.]|nr:alpha/beta fold hydrolase [Sphingomonas sp.]